MKYLTNEPIGEDWYDGKAQTALAKRIVAEIKKPSTFMGPAGRDWEHTVVMALEGPWGCGKSNVLKMVENEIGYTFGANQEKKLRQRLSIMTYGCIARTSRENPSWNQLYQNCQTIKKFCRRNSKINYFI